MISYNLYDVIRQPLVTEKTTDMAEQNKYTFEVVKVANKNLVKKAIEAVFGVKVEKVNIMNVSGKVKRFKGRLGRTSDFKKAIVTLEKNQTLDLAGGVK